MKLNHVTTQNQAEPRHEAETSSLTTSRGRDINLNDVIRQRHQSSTTTRGRDIKLNYVMRQRHQAQPRHDAETSSLTTSRGRHQAQPRHEAETSSSSMWERQQAQPRHDTRDITLNEVMRQRHEAQPRHDTETSSSGDYYIQHFVFLLSSETR